MDLQDRLENKLRSKGRVEVNEVKRSLRLIPTPPLRKSSIR